MKITWKEGQAPAIAAYIDLRARAGLSVPEVAAARVGLAGGLHAVTGHAGGDLVAMGRIVGDGGTAALIVDVAVDPDFQRQGLGTEVMRRLSAWCDAALPPSCLVALIADPGAFTLYRRFGFDIRTGMLRAMR